MYTVIARHRPRELALTELPPLIVSLILADTFFVFHRFSLECLAFLATWYALSWLQSTLVGWLGSSRTER